MSLERDSAGKGGGKVLRYRVIVLRAGKMAAPYLKRQTLPRFPNYAVKSASPQRADSRVARKTRIDNETILRGQVPIKIQLPASKRSAGLYDLIIGIDIVF